MNFFGLVTHQACLSSPPVLFIIFASLFSACVSLLLLVAPAPLFPISVSGNVPKRSSSSVSKAKPRFLFSALSFSYAGPRAVLYIKLDFDSVLQPLSQWCHRLEPGPHSGARARGTADNGSLIRTVNSWWDDSCNKGSDDSLQAERVKRVSVWLDQAGAVILFTTVIGFGLWFAQTEQKLCEIGLNNISFVHYYRSNDCLLNTETWGFIWIFSTEIMIRFIFGRGFLNMFSFLMGYDTFTTRCAPLLWHYPGNQDHVIFFLKIFFSNCQDILGLICQYMNSL